MIRILYQVGMTQTRERLFEGRGERVTTWVEMRRQVGEAILARDPEMAALLERRRDALILEWIEGDRGEPERSAAAPPPGPSR